MKNRRTVAAVVIGTIFGCSTLATEDRRITSQIADIGFDFSVQRNIVEEPSPDGGVMLKTNQFTILGNNINYLEDGQWKVSEDLIEPFAGGAVARRGPNRAIFAPDLNTADVFDILTRSGVRIRGGVRALAATDFATGQSVVLARVKERAPGLLDAPTTIVFADAFDGLKADVVYIWRNDIFCQDIVLQERPQLPAEFNPATVRFEVVTEFFDANPTLTERVVEFLPGQQTIMHPRISFGDLTMVSGGAFRARDGNQLGAVDWQADAQAVRKEWVRQDERTSLLIESISWPELLPAFLIFPCGRLPNIAENLGREGNSWLPRSAVMDGIRATSPSLRRASEAVRLQWRKPVMGWGTG